MWNFFQSFSWMGKEITYERILTLERPPMYAERKKNSFSDVSSPTMVHRLQRCLQIENHTFSNSKDDWFHSYLNIPKIKIYSYLEIQNLSSLTQNITSFLESANLHLAALTMSQVHTPHLQLLPKNIGNEVVSWWSTFLIPIGLFFALSMEIVTLPLLQITVISWKLLKAQS